MIDRIKGIAKKDPVLAVSWVLAALSALWVRPDKEYAGYIDADTSVNVREAASISANVLITLNPNTEVTVVGEENDFYKIEYKEYKGYVAKRLISDK